MAQSRPLRNPPIQEAVIQFEFAGVELGKPELEALANVYTSKGWRKNELHTVEATLDSTKGPPLFKAGASFSGLVLVSPNGHELVQVRSTQISGSTRSYTSWEILEDHAQRAFETFIKFANPTKVSRISTRFINRIASDPKLSTFNQILERPPLPLEGLPGASITDFLRRHVVSGLENGFSANLTIGTVEREQDEDMEGKPLVIDIEVSKSDEWLPAIDTLKPELASLRSIKNQLFFGSLKESVVERFE